MCFRYSSLSNNATAGAIIVIVTPRHVVTKGLTVAAESYSSGSASAW